MHFEKISDEEESLGKEIINAAFRVHRTLGPGLLEKVYEACVAHELNKRNIPVARQVTLPIIYDGIEFKEALRLDLLVDGRVVVEIKAIETVNAVWQAQVLSHLRLSNLRLGYVINFHVPLIKDGIKRIIL
jgi:GxxExxY protein